MRGQALLQLSQIGLQFDESKSDNPFAYYTAAITNSFTRVLNIEKKNQSIRDDILEMNGLNPSWTRQNAGIDAKVEDKFYEKQREKLKEQQKSK
jgi:diacylglycerol kinase family enzyme